MTVVLERLLAHPRLPLVAGVEAGGGAVHVWDFATGRPEPLETIPGGSPGAAWHPHRPVLVVSNEDGGWRWNPAGTEAATHVPKGEPALAFAPDGRTLWTPGRAVDLVSGAGGPTLRWDTGVTAHPGGGVVATLASSPGSTLVLFARAGQGPPRLLRRAVTLPDGGYTAPVFSPDGRLFALRGNASADTLDVFEFPSLRKVLGTVFDAAADEPAWAPHNLAFDVRVGFLWAGTPAGTVAEIDVATGTGMEHDLLSSPVTALAALPTAEVVVAGAGGELVVWARPDAANAARTFLGGAAELPPHQVGRFEGHLDITDGRPA